MPGRETVELDVAPRVSDVRPFPKPTATGVDAQDGPLARRIAAAWTRRGPAPRVIAAERVTSLVVEIPRAASRNRLALLTFAVEERLGAAIDGVVVAPAPGDPGTGPDASLVFVVSREALAAATTAAPGAPIVPDFLALRRPMVEGGGPAWAAWRDGARVVVRRSDGTGFACATDMLAMLWARAGRPALLSLGAALPSGLRVTDLSASPPPPDPRDLAFSFRAEGAGSVGAGRAWSVAAATTGVALVLHLGLAGVDAVALGRIADAERARAEAALAPVLPGLTLDGDLAPILARLAPAPPTARRSDFLALLAETSAAVAATDRAVTLRRLSWGAEDGTLAVLMQGPALDDLQAVEQALAAAGLAVTAGAASAGDGAAEVEMRIGRGGGA